MSRRNTVGSNFLNFVNVYEKVVWKMKILERSFNRREFFSFFLGMMRETLVGFISIVFIYKKNDVLLLDKKRNSCFWTEWNLSFMRLLIS